jgi:GNAT superfamily N-acetyltransferase
MPKKSSAPETQSTGLSIYPLTSERWDDLAKLFGPIGADGGCWCMYWRFTAQQYAHSTKTQNKSALQTLLRHNSLPSLLAYAGHQPIGWCGVSPRLSFARLARSRYFPASDDTGVWSIVCFFIQRQHRRHQVATTLLRAAVPHAFAQGASALEAYPIRRWTKQVSNSAAFPGTLAMFQRAGFREVVTTDARSGGQQRVVMRYEKSL